VGGRKKKSCIKGPKGKKGKFNVLQFFCKKGGPRPARGPRGERKSRQGGGRKGILDPLGEKREKERGGWLAKRKGKRFTAVCPHRGKKKTPWGKEGKKGKPPPPNGKGKGVVGLFGAKGGKKKEPPRAEVVGSGAEKKKGGRIFPTLGRPGEREGKKSRSFSHTKGGKKKKGKPPEEEEREKKKTFLYHQKRKMFFLPRKKPFFFLVPKGEREKFNVGKGGGGPSPLPSHPKEKKKNLSASSRTKKKNGDWRAAALGGGKNEWIPHKKRKCGKTTPVSKNGKGRGKGGGGLQMMSHA